ncbi:bifunctional 2-C-methyl-D-erythritol 4-phosphate cytidylyltransferase/2-C-methyl-D-erythritol 2,4-cyclodiphosphate synthase [Sphingorhabdus sp. Alg239-R122]|uniref:bifunctional 2-C-methyl-D-erythritol 4-phosphate cytidylyltransferase/2-C-methyl-D-erythritol 2,4-cyclodiphosphate synthase n=1 Tax=Sphingorhabdus sp. Alg239-R122 TaxID=2305989 RepID=UPI0013D96C6A|nr:bifunctional 2-C-methyl-D-erythritol 4-phosphate cytidylyltransferase/2-C-methyl-D-erythritol 2,4-cyclodiphosphate synthase [Sphingorhabdus sp. Alg239-R122]
MHNPEEKEPAPSQSINRVALIVAAGKGVRAGGVLPKQFREYIGKPLLRHSVEAFQNSGLFDRCVVVIAHDQNDMAAAALNGLKDIKFLHGGDTRQKSVYNGLASIAEKGGCDEVYIHDAARPRLSFRVIQKLVFALRENKGVVPVLPVVDSLSRRQDGHLAAAINRDGLCRVQTPQAFHFDAIYNAHKAYEAETEATDDARVAQAAAIDIALIDGDEALRKITFPEDFNEVDSEQIMSSHITRTGMGFDVHRLVKGEELWLCGLLIPHDMGLAGHSDADVALHAITDALLGSIADGDIGDHFPPSDERWKGARSDVFVEFASERVRTQGGSINNIDLTIICETPRIGPYRDDMRQRLADMLGLDIGQVSVKATTTERLGATGRGEGIAAQAVVTIAIAKPA